MRVFLRDAQEWGWCEPRFDPIRVLRTPRSVRAQIGPKPRVIADEIWAKLLWAGLNLAASDLPTSSWYPLAMVRAVTMTWLFAGLRSDELMRLGVGCIRWQDGDAAPGAAASRPQIELPICLLDVPTHKTGVSYTKPVDSLVGETIRAWEAERPAQPAHDRGCWSTAKRSRAARLPRARPGSTTTSAMDTAPTASLSSARIEWPALAATSTCPKNPAGSSSRKRRATFSECWQKFR